MNIFLSAFSYLAGDMLALISPAFVAMLGRLLINIIVLGVLVHFLYYPKSKRRDFYFTFMLVGIAIFFLIFFMMFVLEDLKGKTSIGIGIGLFGIFSIMRYRTDTMPVREMTYLFMIICLSVINALGVSITILELAIVNLAVILATWYCEQYFFQENIRQKLIKYDRVELIKPENREKLEADLLQRTGLNITKIEIGGIDFLKDTVILRVSYIPQEEHTVSNSVDSQFEIKKEQWKEM